MKTNKPVTLAYRGHIITIPAGVSVTPTNNPEQFKVLDLHWLKTSLIFAAMHTHPILVHEDNVSVIYG